MRQGPRDRSSPNLGPDSHPAGPGHPACQPGLGAAVHPLQWTCFASSDLQTLPNDAIFLQGLRQLNLRDVSRISVKLSGGPQLPVLEKCSKDTVSVRPDSLQSDWQGTVCLWKEAEPDQACWSEPSGKARENQRTDLRQQRDRLRPHGHFLSASPQPRQNCRGQQWESGGRSPFSLDVSS